MKYLTLIRAIALLHQHQRPVQDGASTAGETVEYIEVTLDGHRGREPPRARGARPQRSTSCRRRRGGCSAARRRWWRAAAEREGVDRRGLPLHAARGARAHGLGRHAAQGPPRPPGRARVPARAPRRRAARASSTSWSTTAAARTASRSCRADRRRGRLRRLVGVRRPMSGVRSGTGRGSIGPDRARSNSRSRPHWSGILGRRSRELRSNAYVAEDSDARERPSATARRAMEADRRRRRGEPLGSPA